MSKYTILFAAIAGLVFALAPVQPAPAGVLVQSADLDPGGGWCYAFTSSDGTTVTDANAWTAPAGVTSIKLMVVAGGGASGNDMGGGGGAGGLVFEAAHSVTPGTWYSITVGKGGTPSFGVRNGAASWFDLVSATGGGGGGSCKKTADEAYGFAGGSGGGGKMTGTDTPPFPNGGAGTAGQGFNGGSGVWNSGYGGGGGGGASQVGGDATMSPAHAGAGGDGKDASVLFGITFTSIGDPDYFGWFAGGGGGGSEGADSLAVGGKGGGGDGRDSPADVPGCPSTGGGGGGGSNDDSGNAGGSGIVVISYVPEPATMALLGLGGLGLVIRRRRRSCRRS